MNTLIELIESTLSEDAEKVFGEREDCEIVEATWAEGFQEYDYPNGQRVPHGTPVGVEFDDHDEIVLFQDIRYSHRPYDENELAPN